MSNFILGAVIGTGIGALVVALAAAAKRGDGDD